PVPCDVRDRVGDDRRAGRTRLDADLVRTATGLERLRPADLPRRISDVADLIAERERLQAGVTEPVVLLREDDSEAAKAADPCSDHARALRRFRFEREYARVPISAAVD